MTSYLVTGANGDIGDAVGRTLAEVEPKAQLLGADANGDAWPAMAAFGEVVRVPLGTDPGYVEAIRDLVMSRHIDLVVPTSEPEIAALAGVGDVPSLTIAPELVERFVDKLATADWLGEHGLGATETVLLADADERLLPVVVKPRRGWGSRGFERILDAPHLADVRRRLDGTETVVQPLLVPADRELTCGVFSDGREIRSIQLRRRLAGGLTARATVEHDADLETLLHGIAAESGLVGCLNVQLIATDDGPRVFEINPRLSSTVRMRHLLGFCDLRWWLDARSGVPPPPFAPPVGARVFRMAREIVAGA